MKKHILRLLACLLTVCLLLACTALAESNKSNKNDQSVPAESAADSAGETVLWTGEDGLFSIEIPAVWTEMDAELMIQLLRDQVEAGALEEAGMNEAMQEGIMQIEGIYALFYSQNWTSNLNISVEDSNGVDVIAAAPLMIPVLKAQYNQVGVTLDVAETRTIGAHECLVTECSYLGSAQTQAILMSADKSKVITLTFTDFTPEIRDTVVASLAFAE